MRLAPEGIPFVAAAGGILLILGVLAAAGGGFWLIAASIWAPVAAWVPAFFRNPARTGPRGPHLALASADGKVVSVEEVDEPHFMKGRARCVSVFMNIFNVHVNRYPTDGTLEYRDYRPGKFFNATLDKASVENERMSIGIRAPNGPVLIRQIAGLVARRIVTDHYPGDPTVQGERLGMIRFGSRVDTFLPLHAEIKVGVGDKTRAGATVIAEWPK